MVARVGVELADNEVVRCGNSAGSFNGVIAVFIARSGRIRGMTEAT